MRNRQGFTLVELLVVIGIIGLLVSILLPAMGKARRVAQRTACAAQLKDIGNQFNMYLNEHKGRLPRVNADGATYGTSLDKVPGALPMALLLKPYNGGAFNVFRCPSDSVINAQFTTDFKVVDEDGDGTADNGLTMLAKDADSWFEAIGSSYEYSSRFNSSAEMDADRRLMETFTARLSDMTSYTRRDGTPATRSPSQIWIFRDCDPFHGKVVGLNEDGGKTFSKDARNFLYADFHVGATPFGDY